MSDRILTLRGTEVIAFTDTSAKSAAANTWEGYFRFISEQHCHIELGLDPTAVVSVSMYIPADREVFLNIRVGDKIAVVRNTVNGNAYLSQV